MGRVAPAGDNAAMESFYSLLQKNVLNRRRRWRTRSELAYKMIGWIEHTYCLEEAACQSQHRQPDVQQTPLRAHQDEEGPAAFKEFLRYVHSFHCTRPTCCHQPDGPYN